ncbi:MAG: DUF3794 domain-containing protein [Schaedlerella sp.]|nr:DUF3794 domain-containing protein [Schaedlerella sp.]
MELVQKNIHYTKEGKQTFDQFYLDEDINVPDLKEDVRQIIKGNAKVKIEDIREVENYLRISGKMHYQILYITDTAEPYPAVLEGKIPFEEMVYIDAEEPGSWFMENVRTEFQASLVHSRKVNVKAMIELIIGREVLADEAVTMDVETSVEIFKKKRKINLLGLKVQKKDTCRIKEEITLPGTKESIGRVLLSHIAKRKTEFKPCAGGFQIQGELLVFLLYLSDDGKMDWVEQGVPYEGKISCEDVEEGVFFHINNSLEDTLIDLRLDEDGEMRVIRVEGTLNLKMNVCQEEEIEVLEDLYSLEKQCSFETKESIYEELLVQNHSRCKLVEKLQLPELKEDVLQICHSDGSVQLEHMEVVGNGILVEGILHISFLYLRANDEASLGSWQGMVPFSWKLECPEISEEARYDISYHIEQMSVSLAGSEAVEIKAVLAFDTFVRKPVVMQMITTMEIKDAQPDADGKRPGIVGYVVKEGDDLWNLAKKYMTTVKEIQKINNLESEVLKRGEVLLILKGNVGILGT